MKISEDAFVRFCLTFASAILLEFVSIAMTVCPPSGGIIASRIGAALGLGLLLFGFRFLFVAWKQSRMGKRIALAVLGLMNVGAIGSIVWMTAITIKDLNR